MKLRLPATSANLGCGYDTLGLALSLYNTFEFWESETNICLDSDLDPADHLVFRAMQEAQRTLSFPQKNATLRVETGIPIKSGLGSSAACVAAGIMMAFLLQGKKIDKNQVLLIGTQIEGHPDNLAPLLYGGLTAALASETGVYTQAFPIDASIEPLIVVPRFSFSTEEARRVLPEQIPVEDAVFNLTRIGLLIGALGEGNLDDIDTFTEDRLHEPYRLPLLRELDPNYRRVREKMRTLAKGVSLSGAGPSLIAFTQDADARDTMREWLQAEQLDYEVPNVGIERIGYRLETQ